MDVAVCDCCCFECSSVVFPPSVEKHLCLDVLKNFHLTFQVFFLLLRVTNGRTSRTTTITHILYNQRI